MPRICLVPNVSGTGGMVSFKHKLSAGLKERGFEVSSDLADETPRAVLIIGGTRELASLWWLKRKGVRLVQRLDGINWLQRKRRTGLRHFLRAEAGNLLQSGIRRHLAGQIVYQSAFAQRWWEDWYGVAPAASRMIHNGIDLKTYTPDGPHERPEGRYRLLVVEGSLGGGYEMGLENAVALAEELNFSHKLPMEVMVVGKASPALMAEWNRRSRVPMLWAGSVSRESIPTLDRSAHLLYAADLHPACPNAVIEALACGLPVAAFDTGALRELVPSGAGCIAPYGGDPWQIEKPDIATLAEMAVPVLTDPVSYRLAARAQAEKAFDLDVMVEKYLHVLLEAVDE
jgi:glycosyltransferase involved in cell wall biosynthesis